MSTLARFCGIVVTSGLLIGCAGAPTAAPAHAETPCLPAIISASFLGWPIVAAAAAPGRVDSGELVPITVVRYQLNGDAVQVHWAQGRLLAVDPSPDTDAPPWIDAGALRPDGSVIRSDMRPCKWIRPTQPGGPARFLTA